MVDKYFKEICERCENHANNFNCEDMLTCPAYKLYVIAKGKTKTVYKKKSSWEEDTTPRNSECFSPCPPTGCI